MTMYQEGRKPAPHVGVPDLNTVATGIASVALAITGLQIYFHGHYRTLREAQGDYMISGWVVTTLSFCALILLLLSASRFSLSNLDDLRQPISNRFLFPLAMSTVLLLSSGLWMITDQL